MLSIIFWSFKFFALHCLCYLLKSLEKSIHHLSQVYQFQTFLFGKHWSFFSFWMVLKLTLLFYLTTMHISTSWCTESLIIQKHLWSTAWHLQSGLHKWKDAFCSFVNCSTERPKEGAHSIFMWPHLKTNNFSKFFCLELFLNSIARKYFDGNIFMFNSVRFATVYHYGLHI